MGARFDWYQATIPRGVDEIRAGFLGNMPGCVQARSLGRGGNGYLNTVVFLDSRGDELGTMLHGGNVHPNIRSTSHRAPAAARLIRSLWPEHRVSRLDVAIDYRGEGCFDHLHSIAHRVAEESGIRTGLLFQPDLLERGRTYRLGSPSSPVTVRLYEKGLHESTPDADPTWTRLEIQVRPRKGAKDAFAGVDPIAAWGATRWSGRLLRAVMGEEPERIDTDPRQESEWEHTQAVLVEQYGRHALAGGYRAAAHDGHVRPEDAVDAYLSILKADLLKHVRDRRRRGKPPIPE